jgi:hypothetical protein
MKSAVVLGSVLAALLLAVVATLVGGLVPNPTGYEGLSGSQSVYIDSESYGWPVPWRIDSEAADEAGIGTGGVSISSLVFSTMLWFWPILAALLLAYVAVQKTFPDGMNSMPATIVISFGIASAITMLGTIDSSTGIWHSGRGFEIAYESAGWPFEWKTNPALPVWTGIYELDSMKTYHETMAPYKMLGYSPVWLAINWLVCAATTFLILLIGAGSLNVGRSRQHWFRRRTHAASG